MACYQALSRASQAQREVAGWVVLVMMWGFSWLGDSAVLIRFYSLVAGGSLLGAGGKLKRKLAQKLNFLLNLELSW